MTTRRLKVVTLAARAGTAGGGERIAAEVTARLDPRRFERSLCITRWNSHEEKRDPGTRDFLGAMDAADVNVIPLRRTSRFDPRPWAPLLRVLRSTDILHTHMIGSNLSGAILAPLMRVPVFVAHEHTWSFEGRPLRRVADRELIARMSDAFIAVSREDRRRMIELEGIDPEDVVFIPNGVAAQDGQAPDDKRAELGLEPDTPVLGAVGVLRAQKRFDILLQAVALLRHRHPGLRVLIAGPGPERPKLEAMIEELGLSEMVSLLGQRTDVAELLPVFDVAAVSSDFEGSPLAVMEFMGAGVPVVATAVGGIPDLIEHDTHGKLVAPRDPEGLADAIESLLLDPDARARLGAAGRERQQAEFDIDVMTSRIADLYEELYERHAAA